MTAYRQRRRIKKMLHPVAGDDMLQIVRMLSLYDVWMEGRGVDTSFAMPLHNKFLGILAAGASGIDLPDLPLKERLAAVEDALSQITPEDWMLVSGVAYQMWRMAPERGFRRPEGESRIAYNAYDKGMAA